MSTLQAAIDQGWLVGRTLETADAFYLWCEEHHKAYIRVEPARKFAVVSLDLNSTDAVLTPEATSKVFDLFDQYRTKQSKMLGNGFYFYVSHVLIEDADDLATMLEAIANSSRCREVTRPYATT